MQRLQNTRRAPQSQLTFSGCSHIAQTCSKQRFPKAFLQVMTNTTTGARQTASRKPHAVCCAAAVQQHSVSSTMSALKADKVPAFIPFLVAGDPDLETTAKAIIELDRVGASVIELGVPYSDPLADGPTIQAAATRALAKGVTLDNVLDMLASVSPQITAPIVMFTYYNPIMARGLDKFCNDAKQAGAAALLVPDIPLEETTEIRAACERVGLELVLLTTPTTPQQRMEAIAHATQGFVYLVSVTGVTGARDTMQDRVAQLISTLHGVTDKSVAVGFGVSKPAQAKQLVAWGAEGVIVGSALVKALGEAESAEAGLVRMRELATELKAALTQ